MANNFSFNEYLVIDTTGSVGIGSTNPIARFYVTGSSTTTSQTTAIFRPGTANQTAGAAVLDVQSSTGTSLFFVSGSGNIGVGISNPTSYKLDVVGQIKSRNQASGDTTGITLGNNGTEKARIQFTASDDSARFKIEVGSINASSERISFYAGPLGGVATNEAMIIGGNGNVGIGTGTLATSRLLVTGSGATSSTSTMHLVNSSNTSLLYVRDDGNIGVGTTSPGYTLQIGSGATVGTRTLALIDSGYGIVIKGGNGNGIVQSLGTTVPLELQAGNGNNGNYYFTSTGNVGIGSSTVSSKIFVYTTQNDASTTPSFDFHGAFMRIGDYTTNLSFTNGVGIKIHDGGVIHYSVGQISGKFLISDTSNDGNALFPASRSDIIAISSTNVGIGTTLIDSKLVVNGNTVISGTLNPDTDAARDLGTSLKRWRTLFAANISGSLTPTGATAGSVFFAGAAGQIQQDNSNFFWDDTNNRLGIGTATVATRLHVYSGATDEVTRFESTGNPYISLYDTGVRQGYLYSNTSSVELVAENSKPLYLQGATEIRLRTNTTTDRVIINSGGVVGINYTPPVTTAVTKLMVSGDIGMPKPNVALLGNLYYDTAVPGWKYGENGYGWGFREDNAGLLQMVRAGNNTSGANAAASISLTDLFTFDLVNNRVGLGTGSPSTKFHVLHTANDPVTIEQTTDTAWNRIYFKKPTRSWTLGPDNSTGTNNLFVLADETAGAHRVTVDTSGNVGINTASMSRKLVVHGSDALINDLTVGRGGVASNVGSSNTAIGYGAGASLTVGYSYNTSVGGGALATNSAGERNTALGNSSLLNYNPTASTGDSTAVGYSSLYNSTTGISNTAVGSYSLYSATTTSYNTAIGVEAMRNGIVMDRSVAVGYRAMYVAGGDDDNVAVGYQSAYSLDKGDRCTAIGSISLFNMKDNTDSTAVGYASLYANTGSYNTSMGSYSLVSNTTGTGNVAVGYAAGLLNSTASGNVAVGYQAMYSNTTASGSVGVGYESLYSSTGADNTAIGWWAGRSVSTGINNVAVGSNALRSVTSTSSNVAVGYRALELSTGTSNTALGTAAGYRLTTGGSNVAIGALALAASSTLSGSTAVGTGALVAATGDGNTGLGYLAGSSITSGTGNVVVGSYSGNSGGLDIRTSNNNIILSDGQGTVRMHIDYTGAVGIGTTTAFGGYMLHLYSGSNKSTNMLLQSDVDMSTGIYLQAGSGVGHFYRPTGSGNYRLGTTSSTALDIQTGGTTAINIDTSQNVGVGTASTGGESIRSYRSSGNTVGVYSNTSNSTVLISGYNSTTAVTAGFEVSSAESSIGTATSHPLRLITGAVERVRVDTSGNVGIGTSTTDATLRVARGTAANGTAMLMGTTNHSHFNYSTGEDTYIRGGKTTSKVYINDSTSSDVIIATGGGYVGVGTTQPTLNSGAETAKFSVQTASDSLLATTAIRMHNPGGFGATRIEWVSDPVGSGGEWRPGFIQSGDGGTYTGKLLFYTNGTGSGNKWGSSLGMTVSNGSVGIGTSTPNTTYGKLHVWTSLAYGGNNTGRLTGTGNTITIVNSTGEVRENTSSRRFKKDIQPYVAGLEKILLLNPMSFKYLSDDTMPCVGMIAEDLHDLGIFEEFLTFDGEGLPSGIRYPEIVPLLINGIKELKSDNDTLKSEIQSLKDQISSILAMLSNK